MARICVFCGSAPGRDVSFTETAQAVGRALLAGGHTLVYGGGSTGQMGLLADTMLRGNGTVIGVIPTALAVPDLMHARVSDMRIVADMHQRKAQMHALADAYLVLPGGLGTLEELFETACWAQLEFHSAPIAIMNHNGLFDHLIQLLLAMRDQQFLTDRHVKLLRMLNTVDECRLWLQDLAAND